MAVPSYVEAANALSDPSPQVRLAALRHLKSAVIGHLDKKKELVHHGIFDHLVSILLDCSKVRGKQKTEGVNGHSIAHRSAALWTEEDDARFQSIVILGSFAHGGPSFIPPILASAAVTHLQDSLLTTDNHPKIITAALKTLNAIAVASDRCPQSTDSFLSEPCLSSLYSPTCIRSLALILAQESETRATETQIRLVCCLINVTARNEDHRSALLNGGVLDLLAARLASYYIHHYSYWNFVSSVTPLFGPPTESTFDAILRALYTIVGRSKYNLFRLVGSPLVRDVFTLSPPDSLHDHNTISEYIEHQRLPRLRGRTPRTVESSHSKNFPALATVNAKVTKDPLPDPNLEWTEETSKPDAHQSSLLNWLLVSIKDGSGPSRCAAAQLAASLYLLGFYSHRDERIFANVVVPCLLEMIYDWDKDVAPLECSATRLRALDVLAALVSSNASLQAAAIDAGAVKRVCAIHRKTFEPLAVEPMPWSPTSTNMQGINQLLSRRLGPSGVPENLYRLFELRESALYLLAGVITGEDSQRDVLLEQGVTSFLIGSMKPMKESTLQAFETGAQPQENDQHMTLEIGNPAPVLKAACEAAMALTRIASLVRTHLAEERLDLPALNLINNSEPSVKKAAVDLLINLTPEQAPKRLELIDAGAVKLLCEHTRSADPKMRLSAMWALKHIVYNTPNATKHACFDELGAGWLVQIISGSAPTPKPGSLSMATEGMRDDRMYDVSGASPSAKSSMPSSDPFGNPNTASSEFNDDFGSTAIDLMNLNAPIDVIQTDPQLHDLFQSIRSKDIRDRQLAAIDVELNIQRHALDFIRNTIMSPSAGETIDFVLNSIGNNEFFELLRKKIIAHAGLSMSGEPMFPPAWGQDSSMPDMSTQPRPDQIFTSPRMLHSAIMNLTHLAAGTSRHRQLLLSQGAAILTPLLQLLSHPDAQVRVAVVFTIQNLTWLDDRHDHEAGRARANELRRYGFLQKLDEMREDPSIDVRERVNTVRHQLKASLEVQRR